MGFTVGAIGDALGGFFGGDAAAAGLADAGLADVAGTAAGTAALDTAATASLGDIGAAGLADVAGGTAAGLGTGALSDAALGAGAAGLGGAGAATADLPPVTVTGQAPAAAGAGAGGGGALPAALLGAGAGSALSSPGGGTDSGVPGGAAPAAIADSSSFLPATAEGDIQPLSSDFQTLMGISSDAAPIPGGMTGADALSGTLDPTDPMNWSPMDPGLDQQLSPITPASAPGGTNTPGMLSEAGSWLSNPKNAATAGLLGISLKNALTQPKLPGALQSANTNAATASAAALPVIQSGGTATPEWASQKASIDATIDQQIKQQTEAIMQAAANSGEGNQNSGIVQQQIAQMTQNANVQRQQLYAQAQQQNVNNAISELSGGDATLAAIGQTQLQQQEQAQQLAAQTAEMALLLQSGGTVRLPGAGVPG